MIGTIQVLVMSVVLLGAVFLLGGLRRLHPTDSYLLTGGPVMVVELTLALCFARGIVARVVAGAKGGGGLRRIVTPLLVLVAAAMLPTLAILFADQALDHSPGVERTLPVLRAFADGHRGSTTYYAVVPAMPPSPLLFGASDTQEDIRLPRETFQRLVAGRSTLTLRVHPGRFGLPWYDIVRTTV